MTKLVELFLFAPDELRERWAEFHRLPKAMKIEAYKLAAAAALIVCCAVAVYFGPDYF